MTTLQKYRELAEELLKFAKASEESMAMYMGVHAKTGAEVQVGDTVGIYPRKLALAINDLCNKLEVAEEVLEYLDNSHAVDSLLNSNIASDALKKIRGEE